MINTNKFMYSLKDTREGLDLNKSEDRKQSNILLVEYFFDLIQQIPIKCSFEIGAFSAEFSRKLKALYSDVNIFAFEANPYNYKHFTKTQDFNGIQYLNKAVSDTNGTIEFKIQKTINGVEQNPVRGNNSLFEKTAANIVYDTVTVESVRLSDFVANNNLQELPTVLWIDVEGASQLILEGSIGVLRQTQLIFIEVEEINFWKKQWLEPDVNKFLSNHGFKLIARDGEYNKQYNQIYKKINE